MTLLLLIGLAHATLPDAATQALRQGDCAGGLAALDGVPGAHAALARASCGQLDPLTPALEDDPLLGDHLRLLHARDALAKDPARALALVTDHSLLGSAALEARLLRGRALIALEQSHTAKEDLRRLLDTSVAPEARYLLARGAELRGDTEPALVTYRATWARHATSPWADRAAERLAAMGEPVPDLASAQGRALALTRAKNLVQGGQAPRAVPLYDALDAATGDTTRAWRRQVAFALFKGREYGRAVAAFEQLGTESDVEVLYHHALALSRTGAHDAAAYSYRRLVTLFPDAKRADTASYKLGYLEVDRQRPVAATREFNAHLDRYPTSRHGDEALWYLGWMAYGAGDLPAAEGHWATLVRAFPKSSLIPPARYWWARSRGQQGHLDDEQERLRALLDAYPTTGAAWMAADRLGVRFDGLGPAQVPALSERFLAAQPRVRQAQALLTAGQSGWARDLLVTAEAAARSQGRTPSLALAHLAVQAGDGRLAKRLASPWCGDPAQGGDPVAMQACYPAPLSATIARAAAQTGVHPLLPYAIMTIESGLRPDVTSPAGACGLMQVMPALGSELHPLLFAGPYDPERLYEPGYNALLGTTELGRLQTRWKHGPVQPSLPLVIAGYNGGVEAVERWMGTYAQPPDAARFSEDISYSETRRYVRKVLGALMAYRMVYGDPVPGP